MKPNIDRLADADGAHVEAERHAKARGEALPPPLAQPGRGGVACPACGCCGDAACNEPSAAALAAGELDALHFRFWSADHKRFDHIGFAHAVITACARGAARR